jgi:hypothetical protein
VRADAGEPREVAGPGDAALDEALLAESANGRISCAGANRVAGRLGVPIATVRKGVERLGLKITGCQLGCF